MEYFSINNRTNYTGMCEIDILYNWNIENSIYSNVYILRILCIYFLWYFHMAESFSTEIKAGFQRTQWN